MKIVYNQEEIKVPSKIGHSYTPVEILNLEYLKTEFFDHRRLKVFNEKGCKCVSCDRVGVFLIKGADRFNNNHIDLYTIDFHLMTVDHILPLSKGGARNDIKNMQPMCEECNTNKGNKI